jgi:hypothetical protein
VRDGVQWLHEKTNRRATAKEENGRVIVTFMPADHELDTEGFDLSVDEVNRASGIIECRLTLQRRDQAPQ